MGLGRGQDVTRIGCRRCCVLAGGCGRRGVGVQAGTVEAMPAEGVTGKMGRIVPRTRARARSRAGRRRVGPAGQAASLAGSEDDAIE